MHKEITIPDAMDTLYELGRSCETTEAPDRIAAQASLMPRDVGLIALARLYVIAETRARFANTKLTALKDKSGEKA